VSNEARFFAAHLFLGMVFALVSSIILVGIWYRRGHWQWYRRLAGGHWERWWLDTPCNFYTWIEDKYCDTRERPGLGRGTPTCEEWPIMKHRWLALFGLGRMIAYTKYVVLHKLYVFQAAKEMKLPWRVLLVAALHDNSKFRPSEFKAYSEHFYLADGTKRTKLGTDGFYDDEDNDAAFDRAWLAHIQRNKHHPQHWIIVLAMPCQCPTGSIKSEPWKRTDVLIQDDGMARCVTCRDQVPHSRVTMFVDEMPEPYLSEMLVDWVGAGMAQGTPDTLSWYAVRGRHHLFGPETRAEIERRLGYEAVP
jgi:hypothetical protein